MESNLKAKLRTRDTPGTGFNNADDYCSNTLKKHSLCTHYVPMSYIRNCQIIQTLHLEDNRSKNIKKKHLPGHSPG